jgi:hypothetical protein
LDALVANERHWSEQNYIYYNEGNEGFKLAQPLKSKEKIMNSTLYQPK